MPFFRGSARIVAVFLAALPLLAAPAPLAADDAPLRGFAPSRVAAEIALEQKFRVIPDAAHAEANLRHLTSQPHMAGTDASREVAEWLLAQYRSFGFDAEIVSYSVWLPQPREVALELIAPEKKSLATPESSFPEDKDTSDPRAVMAFNSFSPSGEVTAPVVYVNYGLPDDYRELASLGVSVEGKIVLARYGQSYRGIKSKLAQEHHAAALILYSDPADDGYDAGDVFPFGPWRPSSGIQRGSVEYTEIYPGDPLTPGFAAAADLPPSLRRIAPEAAVNLPSIPTMPINSQDASAILSHLSGAAVPHNWQGGLPFTYHVGPGDSIAHLKLVMDFQQRPIYDVIAKLHGEDDNQWVVLGNHHDAWVFGAVDPGSGTASLLEAARALGQLVREGWKPRRTIVIAQWDAEEPGLIGSTEWVEDNLAELQAKAVAYINTDVGVAGPNFTVSATPQLAGIVRDVARSVDDPHAGRSVYDLWRLRAERDRTEAIFHPNGVARPEDFSNASGEVPGEAPVGSLGAGSDFCPFLDHAGIPSLDVGFTGEYGVYHSRYDDFFWMQHFGDPSFVYHATLARLLGTLALRLDEADLLPYDYSAYAREISRSAAALTVRARKFAAAAPQSAADAPAAVSTGAVSGAAPSSQSPWPTLQLDSVAVASSDFSAAADRASAALAALSSAPLDPEKAATINRLLVEVEQDLLIPEGLLGRPWYRHAIFAPGSYAGYAAELLPGPSEALDRNDPAALATESAALAAALHRAAARLDQIVHAAQSPAAR
ncbi:MAG: M28 family metallopeptidase [Candidatus Acidiferrales bacterium]